jgi:hypothetical protein
MGHDVGKQGKGIQTDIRGAGTRRLHIKRNHRPKQTNTVHWEHFEGKREPHPYNNQASPRLHPNATNSALVRHPDRASSGRRRSPARMRREMLLGPAPNSPPLIHLVAQPGCSNTQPGWRSSPTLTPPSLTHLTHFARPDQSASGFPFVSFSHQRHGSFQAPLGSQMLLPAAQPAAPKPGSSAMASLPGRSADGDISLSRSPHSLLISSPPPPSSETLTLRTSASSCLLLPFYLFARFLDCIRPLLSIPAWCFPPSTSAITTLSPSS